jgi:hypothetical protein
MIVLVMISSLSICLIMHPLWSRVSNIYLSHFDRHCILLFHANYKSTGSRFTGHLQKVIPSNPIYVMVHDVPFAGEEPKVTEESYLSLGRPREPLFL